MNIASNIGHGLIVMKFLLNTPKVNGSNSPIRFIGRPNPKDFIEFGQTKLSWERPMMFEPYLKGGEKESAIYAGKLGYMIVGTTKKTDSVYYYADNLEIYIDKDINEVCPHCSFSTSINDRIRTGKDSEINLFPIPSTGQVMISGLNQQAEIFIYNMNGIAVKQTCAESSFSISEVPAGIYFIEIYTDKGIVVKRIVKK